MAHLVVMEFVSFHGPGIIAPVVQLRVPMTYWVEIVAP